MRCCPPDTCRGPRASARRARAPCPRAGPGAARSHRTTSHHRGVPARRRPSYVGRRLEAAHEKQRSVRNALLQVATADELGAMHLAALPERPEEDDEEEGYRSTHPKAPVSRTPFTMAAAGANKKQKLTSAGGAGSSSAGAGVDVD